MVMDTLTKACHQQISNNHCETLMALEQVTIRVYLYLNTGWTDWFAICFFMFGCKNHIQKYANMTLEIFSLTLDAHIRVSLF